MGDRFEQGSVAELLRSVPFTLGALSTRAAARWPDAVALKDDSRSLTFRELEHAVAQFANVLSQAGVERGQNVAVLGSKDVETVVAMLAIARAGAAYVALDPNLPKKRLTFVLADCAATVAVGRARLAQLAGDLRFIASEGCWAAGELVSAEPAESSPRDVAYLIYTSGSTGHPKGVQIEHRSIEAFFLAHNARAGIAAGDRCMNTGPFHFDVSVMDVLLPLYFGACVILTPELPMPKLLLQTIQQERITHFYAVGSILAMITGNGRWLDGYDLSSLRLLQTGAEVCNPRVVNEWLQRLPTLRFLNSYGPTELTVGCTCYLKTTPGPLPDAEVPIGALHEGSLALLLDADGAVCAGDEGELAIAGAQVMRGYHRRPEEEQAAIVVVDGQRYYRTGDLVRRSADGQYFYRGRRDHEVKIDGCRVHLNEIKRCLEAHPDVTTALVGLVTTRHGRKRVGVALVMQSQASIEDIHPLLPWLASELPAAFVPSALLIYDELPRTPTGKADQAHAMAELERRLAVSTDKIFLARAAEPNTSHELDALESAAAE